MVHPFFVNIIEEKSLYCNRKNSVRHNGSAKGGNVPFFSTNVHICAIDMDKVDHTTGINYNFENKHITEVVAYKEEIEMNGTMIHFPKYDDANRYASQISKIRDIFLDKLEKGTLFSFHVGGEKVYSALKVRREDLNMQENDLHDLDFSYDYFYGDLTVSLKGVFHTGFPSVDYTVTITNTGTGITPKISEFCGIDAALPLRGTDGNIMLRTTKGNHVRHFDHEPIDRVINALSEPYVYGNRPDCSRSTREGFPYFAANGDNENYTIAIGWSGRWYSEFYYDGECLNVKAMQRGLSTVLCPGESIRSPRIVMCFSDGDDTTGYNLWRRLFICRYLPNRVSKEESFKPPFAINFWGATHQDFVIQQCRLFRKAGVEADLVWLDAGWNGTSPIDEEKKTSLRPWYAELGDWVPHPYYFKDSSFKAVSDAIHGIGARFMLWGQIEEARGAVKDRLTFGRDAYYNYEKTIPNWANDGVPTYTLRFSDDKVVDKVIDFFKRMHKEHGVDCVRMDSFDEPFLALHSNDEELSLAIDPNDRTLRNGYTENRHILGLYRLWDTLYREIPGFFMDDTCSGGFRMDVELCSRGVTMWRTDSTDGRDREEDQSHTQRLARWIPLQTVGTLMPGDPYDWRSMYSGTVGFGGRYPEERDLDQLKQMYDEYNEMRPYWYGDYYQLLTERYDQKSWQAYELFREDLDAGFAVAIRRAQAQEDTCVLKLEGLADDTMYEISQLLGRSVQVATGSELKKNGFTVTLAKREVQAYMIRCVK